VDQEQDVTTPVPEPPQADEKNAVSPTVARFLFVEIAAQRAKQLRRGALNRLRPVEAANEAASEAPAHKPERLAMEEVRQGYVEYELGELPLSRPKLGGTQ
jgi:DNA-directed RNA polymerase subunit K/omega